MCVCVCVCVCVYIYIYMFRGCPIIDDILLSMYVIIAHNNQIEPHLNIIYVYLHTKKETINSKQHFPFP
jgi:ABC-type arginine/histidine transport system permease subunit